MISCLYKVTDNLHFPQNGTLHLKLGRWLPPLTQMIVFPLSLRVTFYSKGRVFIMWQTNPSRNPTKPISGLIRIALPSIMYFIFMLVSPSVKHKHFQSKTKSKQANLKINTNYIPRQDERLVVSEYDVNYSSSQSAVLPYW